MQKLGQRLGCLHREPVQVQVARVLAGFEEALRLGAGPRADGYHRKRQHVGAAARLREEEVRYAESAPLGLPRKGEAQQLWELLWQRSSCLHGSRVEAGARRGEILERQPRHRRVDDEVVAARLARKVAIDHLWLKPSRLDGLL